MSSDDAQLRLLEQLVWMEALKEVANTEAQYSELAANPILDFLDNTLYPHLSLPLEPPRPSAARSSNQLKSTNNSMPAGREPPDENSNAAASLRVESGHALRFDDDPAAARGDGGGFNTARTQERSGDKSLEASEKQALPAALGMKSDHLLGVDPSLLQRLALDADDEDARGRVQQRLVDTVESWAANQATIILGCLDGDISLSAPTAAEQLEVAGSKLLQERQQLEEDAAAVQQLLVDVARQQRKCAQAHEALASAAVDALVTVAPPLRDLEKNRVQSLQETSYALRLQLRATGKEVLAATYTDTTVPAFQQVRQMLMDRKNQFDDACSAAKLRLDAYRAEPSFPSLAAEYERTKEAAQRLSECHARLLE